MAASTAKRGSEGRRAVASAAGKESHGSFDSEGRRAMMADGFDGEARHRREASKGGSEGRQAVYITINVNVGGDTFGRGRRAWRL